MNPYEGIPQAADETGDASSSDSESQSDHKVQSFSQDNAVEYSRRDQVHRIAKRRTWGLLFTILLVSLTFAILIIWKQKGYVPNSSKTLFNFLSTVLSLALGINFSEAFKGLAKIMRWKFLATERHTARELDLILGSDNFLDVAALGKESRSKHRILSICVSWILLFLCATAAVSLVSLTYDFDSGSDYHNIYVTPDNVQAPDLSCFFHSKTCPIEETRQGLAHSYGQMTLSSDCGNYTQPSDILNSKHNYPYYCCRTCQPQRFAYRFLEFNPKDKQKAYPWMTDRIITASSGDCIAYEEINSTETRLRRHYNFRNSDAGATTYIYRGFREPQNASKQFCGQKDSRSQRCMWMWAHQNLGKGASSIFYRCPITISNVSNTVDKRQQVPDDVALLAAASIGVNGLVDANGNWTQFQFFPFGSPWEIHYHDAGDVGANMAEFAIGSISHMASRNPHVSFRGNLTHLGQRLDPHWESAIPLLLVIIAAHFALFTAAVFASKSVVITDDSPLAIARLLRPLVDVLGDSGTTMSGKEIGKKIGEKEEFKQGVVYGPRKDTSLEIYRLDIGKDTRTADGWPGGRHPDGTYQ